MGSTFESCSGYRCLCTFFIAANHPIHCHTASILDISAMGMTSHTDKPLTLRIQEIFYEREEEKLR
jgi:hypothetical protein